MNSSMFKSPYAHSRPQTFYRQAYFESATARFWDLASFTCLAPLRLALIACVRVDTEIGDRIGYAQPRNAAACTMVQQKDRQVLVI